MDREKRVGSGRIKEDKTSYLSQVPDGRLRDAKLRFQMVLKFLFQKLRN